MSSQDGNHDGAQTTVVESAQSDMFESAALTTLTASTSAASQSPAAVVAQGAATIMASGPDPLSFLTVQNQNGQVIIQQPRKPPGNGPTFVSNGTTIPKGHIVVKQKPAVVPNQQIVPSSVSSSSSSLLTEVTLDKAGIKRPLTSSSSNVITKVIITKNPLSGQPQPFPAGSTPQTFTLTSVPSSSAAGNNASSGSQLQGNSASGQQGTPTKTVTITSQGILSPVKTVIATIPGAGTKINVPYHKIPISPAKTPTKITMIPVSRSPNKSALNSSSITVLSRALNSLAQSGNVAIKPGSPSKVIIKQGPAPTGSAITLKAQPGPVVAPQSVQPSRAPQVVANPRAPQVAANVRPMSISNAASVQQIQVPGSRFHYVRLVSPASQSLTTTVTVAKPTMSVSQVVQAPRTMAPITVSSTAIRPHPNQVKITLPVNQNTPLAPKPTVVPVATSGQSVHRVILPATSAPATTQASVVTTLAPIQPAPSTTIASVGQLPPGTAILSAGNSNIQGLQGFALVPASYVTQLQQQLSKPQTAQATIQQTQRQQRDYVPIASIDPAITQYTVSRNTPSQNGPTLEATGARPRKPCNCTKSQCLKLYCDCFANGEFCQNCNCTNCANNLEHEEERSKAIKSCLDRNPQAFHPKIGKAKDTEGNRRHNKGCNCKRSGCLKNYCECYEAKIMCSNFCKCFGCKNFEESPERKTLMHLADAAEVRVQQQTAAKTKLSSQISCVPSRPPAATATGERLPFALITSDVAEATSACLLAQAEEAERMKMPPVVQERMIIEEFGRCLMQIIESANRTRTANSVA
ncbi:protein lin-54 homolog [Aplysia californica]|uniref:Protein lin-54 homolog n=1 Tax=Aplysia californica TaxID=6500 RepID=A0ABM0K3S8_APLCA|nr:protein lin-54 homolog [Aplysia californica]